MTCPVAISFASPYFSTFIHAALSTDFLSLISIFFGVGKLTDSSGTIEFDNSSVMLTSW
jgi:hypothetical protein